MAAAAPLNPLTLIHGDEGYLVDQAVRAWRELAKPPQLDVEVFDAPGRLDGLRSAVAEMPLFDPERALLVRDPPQLTGAAKRGGADPPERLAAILAERAPTTLLCLVSHAKVPDRNPVLAAVKELRGAITFHAAKKGRELRTWVEGEIAARGLRLGSGSVEHLVRFAGPDLGTIASELDKLVAFAAGRPLSVSDVRLAVAGDEESGLYDTLGDLLGPTPARGRTPSIASYRKDVQGRTCSPSLPVRSAICCSCRRTCRRTDPRRVSRPRSANRTGWSSASCAKPGTCPRRSRRDGWARSTMPIESSRSARSRTPTAFALRYCGLPPT